MKTLSGQQSNSIGEVEVFKMITDSTKLDIFQNIVLTSLIA